MKNEIVVPAQIRAARALLDWSQERLASEAEVGLTTVRDIEGERRSEDVGAISKLVGTLRNEGITFLVGDAKDGPGVRFQAKLPNVIRIPKGLHMDVLHFTVELHGRSVIVGLDHGARVTLGSPNSNQECVSTFEKYRRDILERVAEAIDAGEVTADGRLYLGLKHFRSFSQG